MGTLDFGLDFRSDGRAVCRNFKRCWFSRGCCSNLTSFAHVCLTEGGSDHFCLCLLPRARAQSLRLNGVYRVWAGRAASMAATDKPEVLTWGYGYYGETGARPLLEESMCV
jgi:hypothetical protein